MYLTYSEYQVMGSGAVDEAAFPRLELLAEQKLNRFTQCRAGRMSALPDAVKYCMADLVDALSRINAPETAASAPLTGFSNDGYSETYAQPVTAESLDAGLWGLVVNWLAAVRDDDGTPLLFLGVDG